MAVTNENSTEYGNQIAKPVVKADVAVAYGKLRFLQVTFTQGAAAGDAGSSVGLIKLPAGKVALLGWLSHFDISAFGASRVLDVGWDAYKDKSGTAVVADDNGLDDNLDVSSASAVAIGSIIGGDVKVFESLNGVVLRATVAGGTIPAGATIKGGVVISVE
jgi:hypothetical protein